MKLNNFVIFDNFSEILGMSSAYACRVESVKLDTNKLDKGIAM